MEDGSDGFEIVTSGGSGAEQSPASSQGKAVGEAEDPAEKPLLPEPAGTAQSKKGWNQQSPSQNSGLPESTEKGTMTASMIKDNGTSRKTWPNFENEEHFPGEVTQQDYHMPDVITVRVETGSDSFQEVVVKVERPTYNKPFLGGFRNVSTGVEFHNAGSQTKPKKRPDKGIELFSRGTQTAVEKNIRQQTRNTTSTQMTKTGLFVSNMTDKLITPGKYFTAEEYHKRRVEAVKSLSV